MLDAAQVVVLRVVATVFVAVVGCDMAVATGSSGCKGRGWGLDCGAVDRPGRECHRFRVASGGYSRWKTIREAVVVVVVNDVDSCDGDSNGDGGDDGLVGVMS